MKNFALLLLLSLAAVILAEDGLPKIPRDDIPFIHFAFEGYEEPEYFRFLEAKLGSDYVKRCVKRRTPPENGTACRRDPKACFFGEQACGPNEESQPTTRCNCQNQKWSCADYTCPSLVGDQCPSQDPERLDANPICSTDLICFYGQQGCCGTSTFLPNKWCTCEAGQPFQCTTSNLCTLNNDCDFTVATVLGILDAGRTSRYPGVFNDMFDSGGGGGGGGNNPNGAFCDIFQQDCPNGFKCTVENIFAGAPRCRPLDDNPDQVGDQCSKLGNNDGDSCDIDGICLGGVCQGLDTAASQCELSQLSHSYPTGVRICEEECDPLIAASCNSVADGFCTRTAGSADGVFSCFIQENFNILGTFGQGCVDDVQCQHGSICLAADVAPFSGFCDGGNTQCCVPLCDLDDNDFCQTLSGFTSTCRSIFNSEPPGLEHVGACVFP